MNAEARLTSIGRPPSDGEWAAVSARRSGGRPFLFLVTSTGIMCTPGCPARTPGRDRVRIIRSLLEGMAAGARGCLRCRPDLLFDSGLEGEQSRTRTPQLAADAPELVREAIASLASALDSGEEPPSDRELATALAVPERRLRTVFRTTLGVTPRAWISARRTEIMRARLANGQEVTAALYDSGYGSSSAAYEAMSGGLGMTPGTYRAGGAGEEIDWTIAPIPEGVALVAATRRGLCSVLMGRSSDELAAELRAEFPRATLDRDDTALAGLANLVSDLASGRPRPDAVDLPLDVHATAFRRRVWEALRRIPAGETRSYAEIAETVGVPGAARAVGTACATNPVPIVVPCHRVVAANGGLGGYSGGLARKRQLLDAEGARLEAPVAATASR